MAAGRSVSAVHLEERAQKGKYPTVPSRVSRPLCASFCYHLLSYSDRHRLADVAAAVPLYLLLCVYSERPCIASILPNKSKSVPVI